MSRILRDREQSNQFVGGTGAPGWPLTALGNALISWECAGSCIASSRTWMLNVPTFSGVADQSHTCSNPEALPTSLRQEESLNMTHGDIPNVTQDTRRGDGILGRLLAGQVRIPVGNGWSQFSPSTKTYMC